MPIKFDFRNPQAKVDTQNPPSRRRYTFIVDSEGEHSKHSEKAESDIRIGNYDQHNQS